MNTTADDELKALLASAPDTFQVDYVQIETFDPLTGEPGEPRRIRVRGANLVEQACFFKRFPDIFEVLQTITGTGDGSLQIPSLDKLARLVLQAPEASGVLNSIFVGRPFHADTEKGMNALSTDASFEILTKGLEKSFGGDIQGFFDRKVEALKAATGWARKKAISSKTSATSSPKTTESPPAS